MNKAFLLGGLFLRVTSVYAAATHGDLIAEGRRRNEEVYEQSLQKTGWMNAEEIREQKANAAHVAEKTSQSAKAKNN